MICNIFCYYTLQKYKKIIINEEKKHLYKNFCFQKQKKIFFLVEIYSLTFAKKNKIIYVSIVFRKARGSF